MNTMTITATSGFHGPQVSQTFRVPASPGRYARHCKSPCDGKRENGVQVHCGCGYPCARTTWTAPDGWRVTAEWADAWDRQDRRNNIIIEVDYDYEQEGRP